MKAQLKKAKAYILKLKKRNKELEKELKELKNIK
jgi:hypothetical protein